MCAVIIICIGSNCTTPRGEKNERKKKKKKNENSEPNGKWGMNYDITKGTVTGVSVKWMKKLKLKKQIDSRFECHANYILFKTGNNNWILFDRLTDCVQQIMVYWLVLFPIYSKIHWRKLVCFTLYDWAADKMER